MYASEATVRTLAKNVGARLATELIAAVALGVDAEIDATLAGTYDWPGLATDPVQEPVRSAANLMTAGLLEQSAYALTEGGGDSRMSYGNVLEKQGRIMLKKIATGAVVLPGADRIHAPAVASSGRSGVSYVSGGIISRGRR